MPAFTPENAQAIILVITGMVGALTTLIAAVSTAVIRLRESNRALAERLAVVNQTALDQAMAERDAARLRSVQLEAEILRRADSTPVLVPPRPGRATDPRPAAVLPQPVELPQPE